MRYPCPHCPTVATHATNLRRHLMGRSRSGGHELSEAAATSVIEAIEEGGAPQPEASLPAPQAPRAEGGAAPRAERAWQRELRRRQCRWREAKGYPAGTIDSRLQMPDAEERLWNFLTPAIGALVREECRANREPGRAQNKVLEPARLFGNLLSSQPLAFNLFGELALDLDRATAVARRLWPERVAEITRIEFEWSPGRRDPRYLDNGTAADVALFHSTPRDGRGAIFIETKYHEDLNGKPPRMQPRYLEVAHASGAFRADQLETLVAGNLRQVWLDHLLVLATQATDGLESALFVLAYPEANVACGTAAERYRGALDPSVTPTFDSRTLEEILAEIERVDHRSWVRDFRARYLVPTAEK